MCLVHHSFLLQEFHISVSSTGGCEVTFSVPLFCYLASHVHAPDFTGRLIPTHSSQGLTEIETPVGGYNQEEGSRGQHWTLSNSPVSTELLRSAIPIYRRSLKQLWVPSYQVLTSLHVFPLSSASTWYGIPLYQEPFGRRTYKRTSCLRSLCTVHGRTAGHQNGRRNEIRHNYDVSAIAL